MIVKKRQLVLKSVKKKLTFSSVKIFAIFSKVFVPTLLFFKPFNKFTESILLVLLTPNLQASIISSPALVGSVVKFAKWRNWILAQVLVIVVFPAFGQVVL